MKKIEKKIKKVLDTHLRVDQFYVEVIDSLAKLFQKQNKKEIEKKVEKLALLQDAAKSREERTTCSIMQITEEELTAEEVNTFIRAGILRLKFHGCLDTRYELVVRKKRPEGFAKIAHIEDFSGDCANVCSPTKIPHIEGKIITLDDPFVCHDLEKIEVPGMHQHIDKLATNAAIRQKVETLRAMIVSCDQLATLSMKVSIMDTLSIAKGNKSITEDQSLSIIVYFEDRSLDYRIHAKDMIDLLNSEMINLLHSAES